jgi:ABC-2 type transport system permease protein
MRDKRSRVVIIVPPIMQLLVFGFAATYDLNNVPVAILNEDSGLQSRELISRFNGSPNFDVRHYLDNEKQIESIIDGKQALLVLHFSQDFSTHLQRGDPAPLQIILDGRNSNTAMIAMNYLREIVLDYNATWLVSQGRPGPRVTLNSRAWYNENLQSRWFIIPGIVALLTVVVALLVTALSVAREREAGTFDQLLVTPFTPLEILLGKGIPGVIIGVIEASAAVILMVLLFEIPFRGSIGAFYLGTFLFVLAAVGVGLMISSLSITQQQAVLGAFLFLVPAVILSGFATPIANMPEAIQWLTYINPLRYYLLVVRGVMLEGADFALLFNQFWPMAIIAVISLGVAGWLFRHRMY